MQKTRILYIAKKRKIGYVLKTSKKQERKEKDGLMKKLGSKGDTNKRAQIQQRESLKRMRQKLISSMSHFQCHIFNVVYFNMLK